MECIDADAPIICETLFAYILLSPGQLTSNVTRDELNANEGGWFGSSIVFQHDTMVMLLYWKKCYSVIGWRKEILWTRDCEGLTTRDDEGVHYLIISERCCCMTASLFIQKIQYVQ